MPAVVAKLTTCSRRKIALYGGGESAAAPRHSPIYGTDIPQTAQYPI
jgi:hypothetical protein